MVPRLGADVPRWYGETIGFWDGDKLVVWTTAVKAADYLRGYPDNSADLEAVEVWQRVKGTSGKPDRIVVQATMYDPVGLTAPWNVADRFVLGREAMKPREAGGVPCCEPPARGCGCKRG